jgi:flagellin
MALSINNTTGLFAYNQLTKITKDLSSSLQKISSGRRINKAADDASGMTIANSLESQERSYGQAIRNANDAVSIVQVADGAMNEASNILMNIRTKAIQAAQDGQSLESRQAIQADIDRSLESLDQIAKTTSFNGQKLLSGNFSNKSFQVGGSPNETIDISIGSVETSKLGGTGADQGLADIDVTSQEGAQNAIAVADSALQAINQERSNLGSTQNQLASNIENLSATRVNIASAESAIADVDIAEESMTLSKMKLLFKARAFASAQANKINKGNILNLLG